MKSRFLYEGKKVVIHTHDENEYISKIINTFHTWYEAPLLEYLKQYKPTCSYVKLNKKGFATEIAEKKVISNHANIGLYFFKRGRCFVEAAKEMIADDFRVKGEFYNAPVYNWMIKKGQKVTIHEISKDKTHLLGTPEELERYINDYAKTVR